VPAVSRMRYLQTRVPEMLALGRTCRLTTCWDLENFLLMPYFTNSISPGRHVLSNHGSSAPYRRNMVNQFGSDNTKFLVSSYRAQSFHQHSPLECRRTIPQSMYLPIEPHLPPFRRVLLNAPHGQNHKL
jgi:hypothetical protein